MSNNKLNRNVEDIDSIIKVLSYRDYLGGWNNLSKKQRASYMLGKYKFSYELGADTKEAYNVKQDYVCGKITEQQYNEFCTRYGSILDKLKS